MQLQPKAFAAFQRSFQNVVTQRRAVTETLTRDEPRLGQDVLPSRSLSGAQRIEIYQEMYHLRLEEVLTSDFPAVRRVMGKAQFGGLVADYIAASPSHSFTLATFGAKFPQFITNRKGARNAWLAELASLERTISEVEEAESVAPLDADVVKTIPAQSWGDVVLTPVPALRLLQFSHRVVALHRDSLRKKALRAPAKRATYALVYRNGRGVAVTKALNAASFALLSRLLGGLTLQTALAEAVPRISAAQSRQLTVWLRDWVSWGLFCKISVSKVSSRNPTPRRTKP